MTHSRVAVTGLGLMTGLGLDLQTTWNGLLQGNSPVRRFKLFDPQDLPSPFGIELPEQAEELFGRSIKKRKRSQMTRGTKIAVTCAQMAIEDAGINPEDVDTDRIGVIVGGTGTGYAPQTEESDPHRILKNMASAPAAWISLSHKFRGPSFVVSTACSSGAYALHAAHGLITSGQCDIVVSGAADSAISYLDVQGFCSLMALSEDVEHMQSASRPFDKTRTGFVLGEGAGMLVLESLEHAQKRGARIHAELSRPGLCSESYNIISPEPEGKSMARAMRLAIEQAGLQPGQIDYINAHGTSTRLNDLYEVQAITHLYAEEKNSPPVSSTKSLTGHCLSAAAGVEAVICVKVLQEQVIPPTWHLHQPDDGFELDFVCDAPRAANLQHVLSNSFAFGGHNGVLVFSRHEARR